MLKHACCNISKHRFCIEKSVQACLENGKKQNMDVHLLWEASGRHITSVIDSLKKQQKVDI